MCGGDSQLFWGAAVETESTLILFVNAGPYWGEGRGNARGNVCLGHQNRPENSMPSGLICSAQCPGRNAAEPRRVRLPGRSHTALGPTASLWQSVLQPRLCPDVLPHDAVCQCA